ncbi:MAG: cobamide remodeling phosphodiesterase CbiR [Candidatus Bipolaricaulia bacterium]
MESYPFKLGVTSLTYPDLGLEENVRRQAGSWDYIELTLDYEDGNSSWLLDHGLERLLALQEAKGVEYTIHLPLSLALASPNPHLRQASVESLREIFPQVECLKPAYYVLHITPVFPLGRTPLSRLFEVRQLLRAVEATQRSLRELKLEGLIAPRKVAVENLWTDGEELTPFLIGEGFSRCFDTGHLILNGSDPLLHFARHHQQIVVIHLHDVLENRDHQPVGQPGGRLDLIGLLELIKEFDYRGYVTLEQFSPEHLEASRAALEAAWEKVCERT